MHGPLAKSQLTNTQPIRKSPHNIEAEQALLGAVLLNNEAFDRIESIEPCHFYEPLHARIFDAMRIEVSNARSFTPVTLGRYFADESPLPGGMTVTQYMGRLVACATSVLNARDYAKCVYDLWTRRQLVTIGEDITNTAYDADLDFSPASQIEEAEGKLFHLGNLGAKKSSEANACQAIDSTISMIGAAYQMNASGRDGLAGLSTGFSDLDKGLGGLAPENLIIIAGRPSQGKSSIAANIAFNVAASIADGTALMAEDFASGRSLKIVNGETPRTGEVVIYSLEMAVEQIWMRELARKARIPVERQRRGDISEDEYRKLTEVGNQLRSLPIHIDGTGALTIAQLVARSRRRKRLHNTQLIVIDYLQLMSSGRQRDSRNNEISEISMALKALAKELKIPIIALSQLSRQVENRENKRPFLSDLRESGSLEQDSDIVMFVYREEYYLERKEPKKGTADHYEWENELEQCKGLAEIIIGKHRHGSVGTRTMFFDGAFTEFADLEKRYDRN